MSTDTVPETAEFAADLAAVYAKTDQGRTELAERRLGLSGRQRSVLIMLDGRKACAELAPLMAPGLVAAIVGELLALGLVAAPGGQARPAPTPSVPAELEHIKRRMIATAESCLGLMAAEVVGRIEDAADTAALLGVLGHWHMALQDSKRGKAFAFELVEEIRAALGGGAVPMAR